MEYLKKLQTCALCLLMMLIGMWISTSSVKAENSGYVYDELHVFVEVNEKREYRVTEVMHIDFEKEMHGIVRDIPKSSSEKK